jgi:hypothetical protein
MKTQQLFDLTGKVALITGGSRGIGLQMAEALGEHGASIALSARKQHELDEAQAHFDTLGMPCFTVRNDLSDFPSIPGLAEAILGHYGKVDILVNNAGCSWGAPAEDMTDEAWHKVMDLDISAQFFPQPRNRQAQHDSQRWRQDHQYRLDRRPWRQSAGLGHGYGRLQHRQGRHGQFHQGTGGRVGQVQHSGQRDLPGLFPD